PTLAAIQPISMAAGETLHIPLKGIKDGNPSAEQLISIAASSDNTVLISHPEVVYAQGYQTGQLTLQAQEGQVGTAQITLRLHDDGGVQQGGVDTALFSFPVTVYASINQKPTIDQAQAQDIFENSGAQSFVITGISDGDEGTQQVSLLAYTDNPALLENISVDYTAGQSTATIHYAPVTDEKGISNIIIKVTDNGGNAENQGDASDSVVVKVEVRVPPITSYEDEFGGPLDPRWPSDWDPTKGEGAHRCSIEDGAMRIEVDKPRIGNAWAGLWFGIPEELDLSENPYISIRMKTDKPNTKMLVFLWDANSRYNTAKTVEHQVTADYVEYYFDFTGLNLQGNGNVVDFSRITALLINFDPGGGFGGPAAGMFKGNFWFDDLRIGSAANRPVVQENVIVPQAPQVYFTLGGAQQVVKIKGIKSGKATNNPVSLSLGNTNPAIFNAIALEDKGNGEAWISLTPSATIAGTATVTLTGSATNALSTPMSFTVSVLDTASLPTTLLTTNKSMTYQTMEGFGASILDGSIKDFDQMKDLGLSMVRLGVVDNEFEPVNDNSNPHVLNMDGFNVNIFDYPSIRRTHEELGARFILTMWSPPHWMKYNKALPAESWATDNVLMPEYYEEYAESLVAIIKTLKDRAGIDLYAISVQNEPQFNEPYASSLMNPQVMREVIRTVGRRFEREGLNTKFFASEALPPQGAIPTYMRTLQQDPEVVNYLHAHASHNYDADGLSAGSAGKANWENYWDVSQEIANPKPMWMTETSGMPDTWNGAMLLAANIYDAIEYGHLSAWTFWSMYVTKPSAVFGLVVDNEPSMRFYTSRQFYKWIRPGAVRVQATSSNPDVLTLALKMRRTKNLCISSSTRARLRLR
ncbi:MAG: hypothetical protein HC842_04130, partial [Cytophagales bacterium]|nr:hypothetical protein [Cytophagales bacterium]